MKAFVWQGTTSVTAEKCMVAWQKVCRPTEMGGLGIPNLKLQGQALRIRWEWLKRTDTERTWVELPDATDRTTQAFFAASVTFAVGDGSRTLFWKDRWLDGRSIEHVAPWVFAAVPPNRPCRMRPG